MSTYGKIAREIELSAISHLQAFYGKEAEVVDLGPKHGYDFELIHSDGTFAIGEITWLQNGTRFATAKAINKFETQNMVPLFPGSRCWAVRIKDEARVNSLIRELPSLIFKIIALDLLEYHDHETWRKDEIAKDCRRLGILHIQSSPSIFVDMAFIRPNGGGGIIPMGYSGLARKLEELLAGGLKSNWIKLKSTNANEKHLYLRMGTLIPYNLQDTLLQEMPEPEISNIAFPEGISHIWLDGGGSPMRNILWRRDGENIYF